MACPECKDLTAHEFHTAEAMVHAFQVAAQELDRGVLRRIEPESLTARERDAMYSALEAKAVPEAARYRFECTTCGDRFELWADTAQGIGGWTREEARP